MSGETTKAAPAMAATVEEVQGIFPSNATLQDAVGRLRLMGFDQADLSLPTVQPRAGEATPNQGAAGPLGEDDTRLMRTMGTSMAGTIGALAAAGSTIATGGAAAVAIAAAATLGAGSALVVNAVGTAATHGQEESRDEAALAGELVLAVHAPTAEKKAEAKQIMRDAGATLVGTVDRLDASGAIDSTGWTG
jgi:hypothetical protein